MDRMDKKLYVITLILLLIPALPISTKAIITLYVDPPTTVTSIGDTFSVNITISDVTDLGGWEFKLYYSSSNLNGTDLIEGPFLKQGGDTYFSIINFTDNYNSTHGIAWVTCALLGADLGVNGNGTLAVVTFKAKQLGTSNLSLTDTWLSDSEPISHVSLSGIVHVLPHDVAITGLTHSKTIVGQGLTVKLNVDVSNQGNFTETFNVTVYANTTFISTQTITLTNGSYTTVTFTWNTTGFAKGNYTTSANAALVLGEIDTDDNTYTDGCICVTVIGDVNGDGWVEMMDYWVVGQAFGSSLGDPNWNPEADVYEDGVIEMMDYWVVSQHYGEHYP
jgi:hypothetical protein